MNLKFVSGSKSGGIYIAYAHGQEVYGKSPQLLFIFLEKLKLFKKQSIKNV